MRTLDITRSQWKAMSLYERFEQVVSWVLTLAISVVIVVAAYRLVIDIIATLLWGTFEPVTHAGFESVFGAIMTLLIAMEFGHSILHAAGRMRSIVQVKTVVLVALLAVARKFIILDTKVVSATTIASLALALLALGGVYWLLRGDSTIPSAEP
jgi:uncharacterized membrane protein (DUF373 family)